MNIELKYKTHFKLSLFIIPRTGNMYYLEDALSNSTYNDNALFVVTMPYSSGRANITRPGCSTRPSGTRPVGSTRMA